LQQIVNTCLTSGFQAEGVAVGSQIFVAKTSYTSNAL